MAMHDQKRSRRDPLGEVRNTPSPMMISPVPMHRTPPRDFSVGKGMPLGAVTPQRGSCSEAHAIGVQWGTASSIGPRQHMEDFGVVSAGDGDVIFGVFDGHGGSYCAEYCQQQLPRVIRAQAAFHTDVPSAIIGAYGETDALLLDQLMRNDLSGGTCALVAIVTQTHVYVGNAGDCRAVYSCDEGVFELSQDHAATNQTEAERVIRGQPRAPRRARRPARAHPSPHAAACLSTLARPARRLTGALRPAPSAEHSRRHRRVRDGAPSRGRGRAADHARAGRPAHEGGRPEGPPQARDAGEPAARLPAAAARARSPPLTALAPPAARRPPLLRRW